MKVILLDELQGKGGEGDIVDVAQGYAENYLFPNRLALPATAGNIKQLEERRHNIEKREEQRLANAQATKEKLEGKNITVDARVGEEGQLFGSVTNTQIAEAINEQLGVEIDRKRIARGVNIKQAGHHEVEVNLYREINAKLVVTVGAEYLASLEAAQATPAAAAPAAEEETSEGEEQAVEESAEETEVSEAPEEAVEETVEEVAEDADEDASEEAAEEAAEE